MIKKEYEIFKINNRVFMTAISNGKTVRLLEPLTEERLSTFKELGFFDIKDRKSIEKPKVITMSINITNQCNLNCKYCFNKNKTPNNLSYEQCVGFIDLIINKHIDSNRFIVDLSGSGEPLLALDLVIKIAKYCYAKSNEINKEVLVTLATNGVLLTSDVAKTLKDNLVLYGISIDGLKKDNANRIDYYGVNCYDKVITNIKSIDNLDYVGAAVTLSNGKQNIIKIVKKLSKYFETISIKPVRNNFEFGINENNIEKIEYNYYKFTRFLIKETLYKCNTKYLKSILNGEDYFGRYIYRILTNQRILTRCDIGYSRYSLGIDGKIYGCPALVGIKNVDWQSILSVERSIECEKCYIRFICGGECMANSYNIANNFTTNDVVMCRFKKYLFKLGHYLVSLIKENKQIYNEILEFCNIKKSRNNINETIKNKVTSEKVTFMNAKMQFDEQKQLRSKHIK